MKLYLIHDGDNDGDNWDLFVWANDPDEAVRLWRDYYWGDLQGQSEDERQFPHAVFDVPLTMPTKPKALRWHGSGSFAINEVPIPTKIACQAFGIGEKREALS